MNSKHTEIIGHHGNLFRPLPGTRLHSLLPDRCIAIRFPMLPYIPQLYGTGCLGGRFQEIPPKSLYRRELGAGFQKFATITSLQTFSGEAILLRIAWVSGLANAIDCYCTPFYFPLSDGLVQLFRSRGLVLRESTSLLWMCSGCRPSQLAC